MTTTLQQLSPSQANQELRVNELVDSLSAAGIFSRRHPVTTGLTWGYYGGRYNGNTVADGTVTLTGSNTNYVVVARATGTVSTSTATTNWNNDTDYARLYQLTTSSTAVTAVVDERFGTGGLLNSGAGGGGGSLTLPYAGDATDVAEPQFDLYADGGAVQPGFSSTTYSASNALNGGTFHCRAARGSLASPTALQAGDLIGGYGARWCYTAGTFHTSSPVSIHPQVTENQTSGAFGSWWRLLTTPKGSTTREERGGITDNGTFWSHDTGTFDAKLDRQTLPISDARFVASGVALSGATYVAVMYGTGTPGFRGVNTGGTAASPSATASAGTLCFLGGHGHDGTNITSASKALINMAASETWSGTAQGTEITFAVTRNTTTTRTTALTIGNGGLLTIAAPPASSQSLLVRPFDGASLNQLALDGANSGFRSSLMVRNTSDTASSDARVLISCGGSSAGDPYLEFQITAVDSWVMGRDNSDSDAFVISEGSAIGTNNRLRIASGGAATFAAGITHGGTTLLTTSVNLTNGAGANTGTLTNSPTTGNPTKWIPINDNGTTRYVPAW